MAAQTLVETGAEVLMLDVGNTNPKYDQLVPDKGYLELRHTDPDQYRYFIGERAEGIPWSDVGKGALRRSAVALQPPTQRTHGDSVALRFTGKHL